VSAHKEPETEHAKLARRVVESYVSGQGVPDPCDAPDELKGKRAGVFVCIKKEGELRGCIGTIQPAAADVAEEITANAISSATSDYRFTPVVPGELDKLSYSVDVLGEPEDIPDMSYLDPKVYGAIVRSGRRAGLLLPDLEGVDTADEQVRIASMKAGISPGEPVTLQRFKVTRHE
jgi:AmmeMemoRadiSam system protein A